MLRGTPSQRRDHIGSSFHHGVTDRTAAQIVPVERAAIGTTGRRLD
jgi:hypothetical protein